MISCPPLPFVTALLQPITTSIHRGYTLATTACYINHAITFQAQRVEPDNDSSLESDQKLANPEELKIGVGGSQDLPALYVQAWQKTGFILSILRKPSVV